MLHADYIYSYFLTRLINRVSKTSFRIGPYTFYEARIFRNRFKTIDCVKNVTLTQDHK